MFRLFSYGPGRAFFLGGKSGNFAARWLHRIRHRISSHLSDLFRSLPPDFRIRQPHSDSGITGPHTQASPAPPLRMLASPEPAPLPCSRSTLSLLTTSSHDCNLSQYGYNLSAGGFSSAKIKKESGQSPELTRSGRRDADATSHWDDPGKWHSAVSHL